VLPELRVTNVRRITEDSNHNAFTDLCRFGNKFYLTFRCCPDGHGISATASVVVMRSDDAVVWTEMSRFSIPDRDTRDPHFLVFGEKLFVYSGTWIATADGIIRRDLNDHIGYAISSDDGENWSDPVCLESTKSHYIWRAAEYDGIAYLNGRRKSDFISMPRKESEWAVQESILLSSSDGILFEDAGCFMDSYGDETAFVFGENGAITALARFRDWSQPAYICRAEPPYEKWERSQLDRNIGGPLLAKWGNFLLAGGRRSLTEEDPTAVLYWVDEERLVEAAELPSSGDCSYPGFVEIDPQHALVSYYSSHEGTGSPLYPASIYLADLEID
jgi:hypothetical protein